MCTTPKETCLRSFFLKVFFLPFFSGAAAPPAAAGFAIKSSFVVGHWSLAEPPMPIDQYQQQFCELSKSPNPKRWFGERPTTNDGSLRFCRSFLLLCDRSFARTLTGTSIGVRTLTADRQ